MDIHPLQTPSTVLTDNLNGTFITYNGNEHVLQNDMGNFKLKKCKLKENYIPIGTASYGDILYIASFDSINKRFELGSYPSPLQWNSSDDLRIKAIDSVIEAALKNNDENDVFLYSNLTSQTRKIIFDDKNLKLNPGDYYKITEDLNSKHLIEDYNYFILDENGISHESIDIKANVGFNPIGWQIPGYLGISNKILTPYEHTLTLKNVTIHPNYATYSLRSKLSIYDEDLLKKFDEFKENLQFKISWQIDEASKPEWQKIIVKPDDMFVKQWLYDKKQIISEFVLRIEYSGDHVLSEGDTGEKTYYERPTNIRCVPRFRQTSDDVSDRLYYSIEYDNLEATCSYVANGKNQNLVAEDFFLWTFSETTDKDGNTKYQTSIEYDLFKSTIDTKFFVFYKDVENLLKEWVLPSEITNETDENGGVILPDQKHYIQLADNQTVQLQLDPHRLYVIFFSFADSIANIKKENTVGRFLYTDPNNFGFSENISNSTKERYDVIYNLDNFGIEYLEKAVTKNGNIKYVKSELKFEDDFIENIYNNYQSLSKDKFISDTKKSDSTITEIYDTSSSEINISEPIVEDGEGLWKKMKFLHFYGINSANVEYPLSHAASTRPSLSKIHKVSVSDEQSYYNTIDIKNNIKLTAPTLRSVYWYEDKGNTYTFRKEAVKDKDDSPKWIDSTINSKTKYSKYEHLSTLAKTLVNNIYSNNTHKVGILRLGTFKRGTGSNSNIYPNSNSDSIYIQSNSKNESQYKDFLFLQGVDGISGIEMCLVQLKSGDSEEILKGYINDLCYFVFDGSDSEWKKIYLQSIKIELDTKIESSVKLYEKVQFDSDNTEGAVLKWLLNGSELKELLCFSDCSFDVNSKIQKYSNQRTDSKEIQLSIDLSETEFQKKYENINSTLNTLYTSAKQTLDNNSNLYDDIIERNGGVGIKRNTLYTKTSEDADLLNFAKSVIISDKKFGILDRYYKSDHVLQLHFGNTDSGNRRVNVFSIPTYVKTIN